MLKPLVSIIVPVYNVEDYLDQCVKSILNQEYEELEIILVDDMSKDLSGEKCDGWLSKDKRISVIHKKTNEGLGHARNTGLDFASGKFVMFIDSDDFIDDTTVLKAVQAMQTEETEIVFYGMQKYIDGSVYQIGNSTSLKSVKLNKDELISLVILEMIGSEPQARSDNQFSMSVCHALYNNDIIKKNNIRFPSERIIICEDLFFNLDYLRNISSAYLLSDFLYYYRYREGSSLTTQYNAKRIEMSEFLFHELKKKINGDFAESISLFENRAERLFLGHMRLCSIIAIKSDKPLIGFRTICSNQTLNSVLEYYPYRRNPLKHRIFNLCLKYRMIYGIYFLSYIGLKKKGNRVY